MPKLIKNTRPVKYRDIKNLKPSQRAKILVIGKNAPQKTSDESSSSHFSGLGNMVMGDMFGTGLPGGLDLNFGTLF